MQENLLVVDLDDNIIAEETREICHAGDGVLHRAITIFVFNDNGELLITRRSGKKKLWPGYWDATCSTHVYRDESYEQSGERRMPEEVGFSCKLKLKLLRKFQYQVNYKDVGSENELCGLLTGKFNGEVKPNPEEVSEYKWITLEQLQKDIKKANDKYSPWLVIAVEEFTKSLG